MCSRCEVTRSTKFDHCFRCGSGDHFDPGCKKRVNAGNRRWLPPRDREKAAQPTSPIHVQIAQKLHTLSKKTLGKI